MKIAAIVLLVLIFALVGAVGWLHRDPRERRGRRDDRLNLAVDGLVIALLVIFFIGLTDQSSQRVKDLVSGCLRTSKATAADVNLNWIYYLSEQQLATQAPPSKSEREALAHLSPELRAFIAAAQQAGKPGAAALDARADADYQAADAKAQKVDYHQAVLIHRKTPLGSGQQPYAWVLEAHFSCASAYR